MKAFHTSLCLAPLLFGLSGCDVAHGATKLQLNPDAGDTQRFEFVMEQKITQTIMGQEQITDQTMRFGLSQTVKEGSGSVFEIDFAYDYVAVEMEMPPPMPSINFDSREPTDVPGAESFAALVGKGFGCRFSSTGEILEVRGVEELIDAVFEEMDMEDEAAQASRQALERQFTDASFKELLQPFYSIYPEQDVAIGDTWERQHVVTSIYPHVQVNTYELLEDQGTRFKVRMNSKVTSEEGGSDMDMGFFKAKVHLEGTQNGELILDKKTGIAFASRVEAELSGHFEMADQDMGTIPITMEQVVSMRQID